MKLILRISFNCIDIETLRHRRRVNEAQKMLFYLLHLLPGDWIAAIEQDCCNGMRPVLRTQGFINCLVHSTHPPGSTTQNEEQNNTNHSKYDTANRVRLFSPVSKTAPDHPDHSM